MDEDYWPFGEDFDRAADKVEIFHRELGEKSQVQLPLKKAVIAFSGDSITWGEKGEDFGLMHCVVISIEDITRGVYKQMTPKQFRAILFRDVGKLTTFALAMAVLTAKGMETSGFDLESRKELKRIMGTIHYCFELGWEMLTTKVALEMRTEEARRHQK